LPTLTPTCIVGIVAFIPVLAPICEIVGGLRLRTSRLGARTVLRYLLERVCIFVTLAIVIELALASVFGVAATIVVAPVAIASHAHHGTGVVRSR